MVDALAQRIKELRTARGLSLKALAGRAGVSAGMLSEVERGVKNPTVRLAYQISQALSCSISALLEPDLSAEGGTRGPVARLDAEGVQREGHSSPLLHGQLEPVVYTIEPEAGTDALAPNRPGTLETVIVLDGELELILDGTAQRLAAGENLSHGVHTTEYRNPSREERCRFLVLVDTTRCG